MPDDGRPPEPPDGGGASSPAPSAEGSAEAAPPRGAEAVDIGAIIRDAVKEGVSQSLALIAQSAGAPEGPKDPVDVSDDEINAAVAEGKPVAHLMRQRAEAIAARQNRTLREEVDTLRAQGTQSLAAILAGQLSGREHYGRFKGEIEGVISRLRPELRANPEVLNDVYERIVGRHATELVNEAREAAARQARGAAQPSGGPSAAGREAAAPPEADLKELFGDDGVRELKNQGGIESFVQKLNARTGQRMTVDDYLKGVRDSRNMRMGNA